MVTSLIIHISAKPLNAAAHLAVKHLQKTALLMDSQFTSGGYLHINYVENLIA